MTTLVLIVAPASASAAGVNESFDGVTAPALPPGWTTASEGSGALWITIGNDADTAPNKAFVPNPASEGNSALTSPVIAVPAGGPTISFRHRFTTEAGWDGGVLEISINGGAFTDIVTAGGTFAAGGYSGILGPTDHALSGRQGWTGSSGGYITTTVNLPAAASGQNIQLRWRFATDSSVGATGWDLDTIVTDADGDGVSDPTDNCPSVSNADQANNDGDSQGDLCDPDDDNDTVADGSDNCQLVANPNQANNDGDSQGDLCDPDDDNDTVPDGSDNCPAGLVAGIDTDGDGCKDSEDGDDDGDGAIDAIDNCPTSANPDQADVDADGQGDACDASDDRKCTVPRVKKGSKLRATKRKIRNAGCTPGNLVRRHHRSVPKRRVITQKPRAGTVLPLNAPVKIIVSKGPRD